MLARNEAIDTGIVEKKLKRMQLLSKHMKELEAEYKLLKDEVIEEYFVDNEEYKNAKGLLLASYKMSTRTQFRTTEFKEQYGELYDEFCELKEVKTFLLK
jgi:hypothetical protein